MYKGGKGKRYYFYHIFTKSNETYISIFLLLITNLLLRKYFILAYDDGSDFDASELVDDSEDQSDDDNSNLSSKDL